MINEKTLKELRNGIIAADMSEKRRKHTLAVEEMAARIGEIYAPDKICTLRAAALLHDITKEYPTEKHIEICRAHGYEPTDVDMFAPKTFHAKTAAMLIPALYPEFAEDEVVSAVRWHTTGHAEMTLTEKIVYLADYIDDTRKFDDCVKLREMFWSKNPQTMNEKEREAHLREVLIASFKMTVSGLLADECPISPDTTDALNEQICEKIKNDKNGDQYGRKN